MHSHGKAKEGDTGVIELKRTHIRIPRSLWDRLKRHFPEYGDVQRIFTQALVEYLTRHEESKRES